MTTTVPTAGPTPTPPLSPPRDPAPPLFLFPFLSRARDPRPPPCRAAAWAGSTGCWRPSSASGRRPCATCPPP